MVSKIVKKAHTRKVKTKGGVKVVRVKAATLESARKSRKK